MTLGNKRFGKKKKKKKLAPLSMTGSLTLCENLKNLVHRFSEEDIMVVLGSNLTKQLITSCIQQYLGLYIFMFILL